MTARAPVAIVTGANRGIGLEVCRQLAAKGFTVLLGARDIKKGRAVAAKLSSEVVAVELDVANPEHSSRVVSEINKEYGRIDVLVNNAGVHYDDDETGPRSPPTGVSFA